MGEVEDQEAGNSRRRRRSAKIQKSTVPEKEESSQVKVVKPVQVMEKEVKKISDENLHPVTIEAEIEDMGKEKKENIDATSVSGFKSKKRTSRTSRTIPEETPKDTSTITNPDAKEVLINAGDTEKTSPNITKATKKRSSRNAPEENHPSADFPEKDVESSSEEKVAKPTAMVELAPSPPPTKAKKRTSRSSRNVPPEESHHPPSTKKMTDLNLETSETSSKTTNRT